MVTRNVFPTGNQAYLLREDPASIVKLKQLLNNLKPGDNFSIFELAEKSGATRKTVSQYLKRDYPQLGLGTGSQTQRAALGQRTKDAADVEYKKLLDSGYLDDYKKKIQSTRSSADKSLSNKALAKKYFPNLSEVAGIGRIERANARIRKEFPNLSYAKADPDASYKKREERKKLYKPTEDEAKILRQQNAQKKILNKYFQNNPQELLNNPKVLQMLNAKLIDGQLDFTPRYKTSKEYIDLAKKGKLFDEFDITPIRSEKRNIQFPANKNIGVGKFNQGFIKQVEAYYKKTKNSTDPVILKNKQNISNYLDSVGIRVEIEGERIGAKTLPSINRETGELPNIKNTLQKLEIDNLSLNKYVPPKTKNIENFIESLNIKGLTTADKLPIPEKSKTREMFQTAFKKVPKKGKVGLAAAGALALTGVASADELPIKYNDEIGAFVDPLNDEKVSQATMLDWAANNPMPTAAIASAPLLSKTVRKGAGKLLSGLLSTLGSSAAGLGFAGLTVKDNLEEGKNIVDATVDPLVGVEMLFPEAAKRFGGKGMQNALGRVLSLGRVGTMMTPVGLGITALGLGKMGVEAAMDEREKILGMTEQEKTNYLADQYESFGGVFGEGA